MNPSQSRTRKSFRKRESDHRVAVHRRHLRGGDRVLGCEDRIDAEGLHEPALGRAVARTGHCAGTAHDGMDLDHAFCPRELWQATGPTAHFESRTTMELTLDALQAEVLKLSAVDRARLLDVLLDSIDEDEEVEREWEQIADERDAELESGKVAAVDGPTVLARLRAEYPG
jgi:Putative addiction module component